MKKVIIATAATMLFMAGCIKSNLNDIITGTKNNTAPDYWLKFENGGTGRSNFISSLNLQAGGKASAAYSIKVSSLQLRVGHTEQLPGIPSILYTTVDFPSFTKPADIAGTYEFPVANQKLNLQMIEITGTDTIKRAQPDSGRLEIKYDVATKTLNGRFNDILFRQFVAGQYVMDRLSGKFKHISLEK
jgi:hypothetical protein